MMIMFSLPIQSVKRTVLLGVKSLWLHRLRSMLTVLGIVFGVCSVIAMLAVGEGASHEAQEQIRKQGSQNIILKSVKPPEDESTSVSNSVLIDYGLKYHDLTRIKAALPDVRIIVPGRIIRKRVWNVGNRVDCEIVGTVPWYPQMRNHPVSAGRFFNDHDTDKGANVCVLSAEVANQLFPVHSAIGKAVRVGREYYRVVGVMEAQDAGSTSASAAGTSAAEGAASRIYIPLSAAQERFGEVLVREGSGSREMERVELHEATVRVRNQEDVMDTWGVIARLFQHTHKKKDYDIIVPLDLLLQAQKTTRIFNIVLGTIAAISLIVGGIGIMNIMLATVTERTREIGIRRALGAKRRDIIIQFLAETIILSGTGGILGVTLGVIVPLIISASTDMVTIVTLWAPLLAFTISCLVGIIFGIYPAMRAANMDPVEALRHE
jgi:putative ABC transport system permease protein